MSSTELFDAASSSKILREFTSAFSSKPLIIRATMRAQVVFPTPRGPQNRSACASFLLSMAFLSVVVMCSCPTTSSKPSGLYLRAETTKLSIGGEIGGWGDKAKGRGGVILFFGGGENVGGCRLQVAGCRCAFFLGSSIGVSEVYSCAACNTVRKQGPNMDSDYS